MRLGSIRPTFGATEILPVDHTMNHKTCRVDILSDHTSPGKHWGDEHEAESCVQDSWHGRGTRVATKMFEHLT